MSVDQKIALSLAKHTNDKQELSRCAVTCINTTRSLNRLPEATRVNLFNALASDDSLYPDAHGQKKIYDKNENDYSFLYSQSYNRLLKTLPQLKYSQAFTDRVWQSVSATLLKSKFTGNWETACLTDKLASVNQDALAFMDHFDSEEIIHTSNSVGNEPIVKITTQPFYQHQRYQSDNILAKYNSYHGHIIFPRYVIQYFEDDYIERFAPKSEIDYDATHALCEKTSLLKKMQLPVEKSVFDYHFQYDPDDKSLQYRTNAMGDESLTRSLLAHELFHLTSHRIFRCSQRSPEETEEMFSFNPQDSRIHVASMSGYTALTQSEEDYFANREEMAAYAISDRFEDEYALINTNPAP